MTVDRTTAETAAAVREIIVDMVRAEIDVFVSIDRLLVNDHRTVAPSRRARPPGAVVLVEMIGPHGAEGRPYPEDGDAPADSRLLACGEARAWCNDEIVSAARRAAETIMRRHPAWRRRPH